eukprot:m.307958 g.307958  ORF g.307958 m.307958 type:complete len:341 (-) comp15938_c0_seq6:3450-4472(-)
MEDKRAKADKLALQKWVSQFQSHMAHASKAIVAMETLLDFIKGTKAETLSEMVDSLQALSEMLIECAGIMFTSVRSACELFMRMITVEVRFGDSFESCRENLIANGVKIVEKAKAGQKRIAPKGAPFIRDGATVLTHSRSRTVEAVLLEAASKNKRFSVFVTESRPSRLGAQMAEALHKHGIPVTLIPDTAVALVMEQVDFVIVGAEAVVESGGVINTTGTLNVAMVAKTLNIPFYVVAQSFKFVRMFPLNQSDLPATLVTKDIMSPSASVTASKSFEFPVATLVPDTSAMEDSEGGDKAISQLNPVLDYTPANFVTLLFTDLGILTPSAVSDELIKLYL